MFIKSKSIFFQKNINIITIKIYTSFLIWIFKVFTFLSNFLFWIVCQSTLIFSQLQKQTYLNPNFWLLWRLSLPLLRFSALLLLIALLINFKIFFESGLSSWPKGILTFGIFDLLINGVNLPSTSAVAKFILGFSKINQALENQNPSLLIKLLPYLSPPIIFVFSL